MLFVPDHDVVYRNEALNAQLGAGSANSASGLLARQAQRECEIVGTVGLPASARRHHLRAE